jgi:hypothetical protein
MTNDCECPYHYDELGCSGPGECEREATIKVPGYGWLCSSCYDEIDEALKNYAEAHAEFCE